MGKIDRRKFLETAAIAGSAGLAGCADMLNGNNNPDSPGFETPYNETDTSTGTSEPSYELVSSITDVDLSDLPVEELDQLDEIRDQDYFELEYQLRRSNEQVNPDDITNLSLDFLKPEREIQARNAPNVTITEKQNTVELEQEADNTYEIECTEAYNGENQVTLTAKINGQTLTAEGTAQKILPEDYLIEGLVDGERITSYTSPYNFDTYDMDWQNLFEIRENMMGSRQSLHDQLSGEDFEQFEQYSNEQKKKREIVKYVGEIVRRTIGRHSSLAQDQARNEENLIQEYTDYEPDQVFAAGFDNPAAPGAQGGNHGSKVMYFDGDWFHHETIGSEVRHITNLHGGAYPIDMAWEDAGSNDEFVSVLAEFGDMGDQTTSYHNRMNRLHQMFIYLSTYTAAQRTTPIASEPVAMEMLNRIRDNQDRDQIFKPFDLASDINLKTGDAIGVLGSIEEPTLLSTDRDSYLNILQKSNYANEEAILEETLG